MKQVELNGIRVAKSNITLDILNQVDDVTRNACEMLYYNVAKNNPGKMACLVNANNKGYCRVKLQKE